MMLSASCRQLPASSRRSPAIESKIQVRDRETRSPALETSALPGIGARFEYWRLKLLWSLVVGIWSFRSAAAALLHTHVLPQERWDIQVLTLHDRRFALFKAPTRDRLELHHFLLRLD